MLPTQLDASQEDIFREVIPDGSAKALSRYTDMVDALIREQNDRLAGASDDARLRLRERDLPDCLQVFLSFLICRRLCVCSAAACTSAWSVSRNAPMQSPDLFLLILCRLPFQELPLFLEMLCDHASLMSICMQMPHMSVGPLMPECDQAVGSRSSGSDNP